MKKRYKVIRICSGVGKEKDIRYEKEKETESGSDGNGDRYAKEYLKNMGIITQQGKSARKTGKVSCKRKRTKYKVKDNHIIKVKDVSDSEVKIKRKVKVIKKQNKDIG